MEHVGDGKTHLRRVGEMLEGGQQRLQLLLGCGREAHIELRYGRPRDPLGDAHARSVGLAVVLRNEGLDVEDGRAVDHVDAAQLVHLSVDAFELAEGEADGVGSVGGACGEDTFLAALLSH